jgi:hypothetical protein
MVLTAIAVVILALEQVATNINTHLNCYLYLLVCVHPIMLAVWGRGRDILRCSRDCISLRTWELTEGN